MKLYSELRGLMAANDYTAEQLARVLGVHTETVKNRMRGIYPFTLDEAYRTLDLFRVPHSRLHEIFPKDGKRT